MLPARSISVISVQAPTKVNTRHLYQLDAIDDLPLGSISLAVDPKIDQKNPKLLKIPLLNTEHNTVHIPRKTIIGKLQPLDVANFKVSNISWPTDGTVSTTGKPMELPCIPPESSFLLEQSNAKQSIVLKDAHILQDAKDGLTSLLEGENNSIISKSPIEVRRTNLFQMDIPMARPPVVCKPHPIPLNIKSLLMRK